MNGNVGFVLFCFVLFYSVLFSRGVDLAAVAGDLSDKNIVGM